MATDRKVSIQGADRNVAVQSADRKVSVADRKFSVAAGRKASVAVGKLTGAEALVGSRSVFGAAKAFAFAKKWSKNFKENKEEIKRRPVENTYQLGPEVRFSPGRVEATIREVLSTELRTQEYSPRLGKVLPSVLAMKIQDQVKSLSLPRYKIVCHVTLGQRKDQDVETASRCLWDHGNDNWACASYQNETLFASASVFGVYFE